MSDFSRQVVPVEKERRDNPRLDFNCPVIINGVRGVHTITDMSLGGVFIELSPGPTVKIGQKLHLVIKLPTEKHSIHIRSKVVFQNSKGIGCHFLETTANDLASLRTCFDEYRHMLPAR